MASGVWKEYESNEISHSVAHHLAAIHELMGDHGYARVSDNAIGNLSKPVVAVQPQIDAPDTFAVAQNIPNPFNPVTTISYELPRETDVSLKIYNVLGQEVKTLIRQPIRAGRHQIVWDSKDDIGQIVSSGIYFYRFIAGPVDETKKMLILK